MTLTLRLQPVGIIDMIPSLPVSTSILIPLVVGLFLAALVLRAQRLPVQPLPHNGLTARRARIARRRVQRSRMLRGVRTVNKGTKMTEKNDDARLSRAQTGTRVESAEATEERERSDARLSRGQTAAATSGFQIYWGRTAVALLGLVALLGGVVTAIAVPFVASLSWMVPGLFAAVLVVSLVSLQIMAVVRRRHLRRRRVENAMQEAMNARGETDTELSQRQRSAAAAAATLGITDQPSAGATATDVSSAKSTRQQPFDAMSSDAAGKGGPDSLLSLDADGLPTDAERLFTGAVAESDSAPVNARQEVLFDQSSTGSWDLREVPSAKYMVAEKADRPEPEPIQTQSPAPEGEVKLKQSAGSPHSPEAPSSDAQQSIDLDHVLRRRRA